MSPASFAMVTIPTKPALAGLTPFLLRSWTSCRPKTSRMCFTLYRPNEFYGTFTSNAVHRSDTLRIVLRAARRRAESARFETGIVCNLQHKRGRHHCAAVRKIHPEDGRQFRGFGARDTTLA